MSDTLNRYRMCGEYAGTRYEIAVDQWEGKGFVVADVELDGLSSRRNDDDRFASLEEAFAAGVAMAKHLIDS